MKISKAQHWRITDQAQLDHLGNYCTLCHAFEYDGGTFQVKQRILDNQDGYREGQERSRLIAAAPDYFAAVDYWIEQIYDGEPLKDWQQQLLAAHEKAKGSDR